MTFRSWMDGWLNTESVALEESNNTTQGMDSPWSPQYETLSANLVEALSITQRILQKFECTRYLEILTTQPWLWIWNAVHASARQANISQWQGQRPRERGAGCICCYCHSYSLILSAPIRCLDNCDLDTHCWWPDITHTHTHTQTDAWFSLRLSADVACSSVRS